MINTLYLNYHFENNQSTQNNHLTFLTFDISRSVCWSPCMWICIQINNFASRFFIKNIESNNFKYLPITFNAIEYEFVLKKNLQVTFVHTGLS
jgi:hypothetical protein